LAEEEKGRTYHSISEVSAIAGVETHVLRYWETQFKMLRPKKNRAGNRMYRTKDIALVMNIKRMLYEQGFTISGARKKLLEDRRTSPGSSKSAAEKEGATQFLRDVRKEIEDVLSIVRQKG
jgi:DNA-binding transcriptional MerR regulator